MIRNILSVVCCVIVCYSIVFLALFKHFQLFRPDKSGLHDSLSPYKIVMQYLHISFGGFQIDQIIVGWLRNKIPSILIEVIISFRSYISPTRIEHIKCMWMRSKEIFAKPRRISLPSQLMNERSWEIGLHGNGFDMLNGVNRTSRPD